METIAAISTPNAVGGIAVIRISGENATEIADSVFVSKSGRKIASLAGYSAIFGMVYDKDEPLDEVIALRFVAPHSYTGEDTVEFSCHGGLFVAERLLSVVLRAGARLAERGEFTKRAFLNGKLDLTEAEAVADIISAESELARRAAINAKGGALSNVIDSVCDELLLISANMAAYVDYPDDDIPELEDDRLLCVLDSQKARLDKLIGEFSAGQAMKNGISTVIAGRPNAGKSTLMNLLCGYDRSIVTSLAGTTRDTVEEAVSLDGVKLHLIDTAGIRDTEDKVEQIGVERARESLRKAELVIAVFDSSEELNQTDRELIETVKADSRPAIAIINKTDLPPLIDSKKIYSAFDRVVEASLIKGDGRQKLSEYVKELWRLNEIDPTAGRLANIRQKDCAVRAAEALGRAAEAVRAGFPNDAVSVDIDIAIGALCELSGKKVNEATVDAVFENFCVGK